MAARPTTGRPTAGRPTTGRPTTGRPTIRDVAELAGVHPGTASRALDPRREGRISAPTAERVRSAARSLGYVPDPIARTLRARRSAARWRSS